MQIVPNETICMKCQILLFLEKKKTFHEFDICWICHNVLSVNGLIKNLFNFAPNHILWVLNGITSEYLQDMFGCIIISYPITRHTRYCTFILTLSKVKKNCALCRRDQGCIQNYKLLANILPLIPAPAGLIIRYRGPGQKCSLWFCTYECSPVYNCGSQSINTARSLSFGILCIVLLKLAKYMYNVAFFHQFCSSWKI